MGAKQANVYLKSINWGSDFLINKFLRGKSNSNFVICNQDAKYVLRKRQRRKSSYDKCFGREANVLRFLESAGIDFVPRSIFLDKKKGIHVVSYLEGRQILVRNLSKKSLVQLTEKIYKINSLASAYIEFCKQNKIKIYRPRKKSGRTFELMRAEVSILRRNKIFPELSKWFRVEVKKDFLNQSVDESEVYLEHGDLTSNQIIREKKIFLIDWEFAKLSRDPGLAYMFFHSRLGKDKRKIILKNYAKLSGLDFVKLSHDTAFWERKIIFRDIVDTCNKYRHKKDLMSMFTVGDRMRIDKRVSDYRELSELYNFGKYK